MDAVNRMFEVVYIMSYVLAVVLFFVDFKYTHIVYLLIGILVMILFLFQRRAGTTKFMAGRLKLSFASTFPLLFVLSMPVDFQNIDAKLSYYATGLSLIITAIILFCDGKSDLDGAIELYEWSGSDEQSVYNVKKEIWMRLVRRFAFGRVIGYFAASIIYYFWNILEPIMKSYDIKAEYVVAWGAGFADALRWQLTYLVIGVIVSWFILSFIAEYKLVELDGSGKCLKKWETVLKLSPIPIMMMKYCPLAFVISIFALKITIYGVYLFEFLVNYQFENIPYYLLIVMMSDIIISTVVYFLWKKIRYYQRRAFETHL